MPELSGRPLIDTQADARLYAPREEHEVLRRSAEQRLNVLVTGARGSGKTTLLRQVLLDLRERGHTGVFVDGKMASEAFDFLQLVRFTLGEAPNLPQALRENYSRLLAPRPGIGEANKLLELIEAMNSRDDELVRTTLLIDGLPSPEIAHTLFGRLRDELWQLPFNWIIAADEREYAALMEPPADAFFDRRVKLGPLSGAEQFALIERRAPEASRLTIETVAKAHMRTSDQTPRGLIALARDIIEHNVQVDDLLAARALREGVASELSRPASMLLAELEEMGSASASDEHLLSRMDWTRPRAAQVFAELEDAGLVTSREEKGQGGRPRRIFIPVHDFGRE